MKLVSLPVAVALALLENVLEGKPVPVGPTTAVELPE